jgi:tetratricopeptide (TPR) repeat protein
MSGPELSQPRVVSFLPEGADRSAAYRFIRTLGSVYHSSIHLAEWSGVEGFVKQLTVWQVRPELCVDTDAVDVLLRGLKGVAALTVSTATQVMDVWWSRDRIAVAAEHVSGISMAAAAAQAARQNRLLPFDTIMGALLKVARALEQAHDGESRGGVMIHGDLRPDFVLFGYEGAVKVAGFGFGEFLPLVSPEGEWCTWQGRCYQPPERLAGAAPSPQTDVFSLGVMLWEAATGRLPYGTDDPRELLRRIGAGESPFGPEPLELAADLAEVVVHACAIDPSRRYSTMGEMAADLYRMTIERRRAGDSRPVRLRELLQTMSEAEGGEAASDEGGAIGPSPKSQVLRIPRLPALSPPPKIQLPTSPLQGRVDVLRAVSHALAGINTGRGRAILITGEEGMGRTRLLAEVAVRLSTSARKLAWVGIRCRPEEQSLQYSSVLRFFASAVGLEPWCELAELVPQLDRLRAFGLDGVTVAAIRGALGDATPPEPAHLAGLLSQGMIQALASLSWEQTSIAAWDDVQWCDGASLSCLTELLERLDSMPVVVLLSASTGFANPWEQSPALLAIELGPLTATECQGLVLHRLGGAERVAPSLMSALLDRSGGNPLLVEQLLDLLVESGRVEVVGSVAQLVEHGDAEVPGFREAVRARLETFSGEVAAVAIAAAFAGPALCPEVIAHTTGLDILRVRACLDGLVDRGVLLRYRTGFAFPHERLRLALIDAAGPEWRDAHQEPMARAILAEAGEDSEGLWEHAASLLIDAGERAAAAEVLVDAARRKEARGDLRGAAQRAARALGLVREVGALAPAAELRLCLDVGRTALHSLSLDLGETALVHARELAAQLGDAAAGATARVMLCRLLNNEGRLKEAIDHAKEAIPLAESAGAPLVLAQVYAAIAESYQQWGQYGPDMAYLEPALQLASQAGDLRELGRILQLAVMHAAGLGKFQRTVELLEQARGMAETSGDPLLHCQVLKAETLLHIFSGDFEAGLRSTLAGFDRAHRHGFLELEVIFLHNAGDAHLRLGRMQEALYYFTESHRRAAAVGFDRLVETNTMYVGFLEATYLRSRSGMERLTGILEKARTLGRVWNLTQGHQLLGRALLDRGELAGARVHLEEALRLAESSGVTFFVDDARHWLDELVRAET